MNLGMKKNTRIEWIDVLKGIVIILVVLGHNIQYGAGEEFLLSKSFYNNHIFKIIYSFHMPCFMLISGFFFGFTISKSHFISNRIRSLLVPIFVWSMIPAGIRLFQRVNEGKLSFKSFTSIFIRTQLTYYWFLWAVLICSCIAWIMYKLSLDRIPYFLIIWAALLFADDFLNTAYWKFMFPYFVIGYLWNIRGKDFEISQKTKWILMFILLICYYGLIGYYNENCYIYTTGIQVNSIDQLLIDLYRYTIGLVGAILLILIVNNIYGICDKYIPNFVNLLAYLGKISLTIYIVDILLNDYVIRVITKNYSLNYGIVILETLIVLSVCILIDYVIKKIPVARRILLGSR